MNGNVLVQENTSDGEPTGDWLILSPDENGQYTGENHGNCAWQMAQSITSDYGPEYYASSILPSGDLMILGGEYNLSQGEVDTSLGAVYCPTLDKWQSVNPPEGWGEIGDAPSVMAADGDLFLGNIYNTEIAHLLTNSFDPEEGWICKNPSSANWLELSPTSRIAGGDWRNDEEGWTMLPDWSWLTADVGGANQAERYILGQGWTDAGVPGTNGGNLALEPSEEMGPAILLPGDKVVQFGGNGHIAIYDPATGWSDAGTLAGSDALTSTNEIFEPADAPAVLLPDGHVLVDASAPNYSPGQLIVCNEEVKEPGWPTTCPTSFFDFDPESGTVSQVDTPPGYENEQILSYQTRLLLLPDGTALLVDATQNGAYIYTPPALPTTLPAPVITDAADLTASPLQPGEAYSITGTGFNGPSQAVGYGDDYQAATNFPLVRIKNTQTGHVRYLNVRDVSSLGVQATYAVGATIDLPSDLEAGPSTLQVVADGVASAPLNVTVNGAAPPTIANWAVTPASALTGSLIKISYTATDASGTGLSHAELWLSPDDHGLPGAWSHVSSDIQLSGAGPAMVTFTNTPPSAGKWWYGTHLFNQRGGEALEPKPTEVSVVDTVQPTTTSLATSATQEASGAALTLTASVQSSAGTPAGEVTFYDGTTALATVVLNQSGSATYSTSGLALGTHALTAKYVGSGAFAASTSSAVSVNMIAVAPQLAISPPSGIVGVTQFTKADSGFTPGGQILHTLTLNGKMYDGMASVASPTGTFSYSRVYTVAGTYVQIDTDIATGRETSAVTYTVAQAAANDFSLSLSPTSASVAQPGSATFTAATATLTGAAQQVQFAISGLPDGVTSNFSPATATTGASSNLTLAASSSATPGTYTATVSAAGPYATHVATLVLTVTAAPASGPPVLSASPTSFTFNSQPIGSRSSPVVISLVNHGSAPLTITSLSHAGPFVPVLLDGGIPATLAPNGGYDNMQVTFIPAVVGAEQGSITLSYGGASPLVLQFTGTGAAAPVTTGNIQILATFNGAPWTGRLMSHLAGPSGWGENLQNAPDIFYDAPPGGFTVSLLSGGPTEATLTSITPAPTQNIPLGSTVTFTFNFTGQNAFTIMDGTTEGNEPGPLAVLPGSTVHDSLVGCLDAGVAQTLSFSTSGLPPGATDMISGPNGSQCGLGTWDVAIQTSKTTPPGMYPVTYTATSPDGYTKTATVNLDVILPPSGLTMASVTGSGQEGNAASALFGNIATSADGRYLLFQSTASNLGSLGPNNAVQDFLHDSKTGTTTEVSLTSAGVPFFYWADSTALSADGLFAAFASTGPQSLTTGPPSEHFYFRDLTAGTTTQLDVNANGEAGNGAGSSLAISADGRYVAFLSNATNLLSTAPNGGIFVANTTTKRLALASVSPSGAPLTGSNSPAMSADGRYVAFMANSATNRNQDIFVHDFQTGKTEQVNVAPDGTADDCGASASTSVAMSPDGRYISFRSCGDNLAPGATDGNVHSYIRDTVANTTTLTPSQAFSFSADGRFYATMAPPWGFGSASPAGDDNSSRAAIADRLSGALDFVDVQSSGALGNGDSTGVMISADGNEVAFGSTSSDLVSGDTNSAADVFEAANPFLTGSWLQSLSLSATRANGGAQVIGTVTLSASAPSGGATVAVWSDSSSVQPAATITVPAGSTSATFPLPTSTVAAETELGIFAAYNGGSALSLLTLEPAAEISVNPTSWDFTTQDLGTTSAVASIVISNEGTAAIPSVTASLASGKDFQISKNGCTAALAAGASCSILVVFAPHTASSDGDTLQVSYAGNTTPTSVELSGIGVSPGLTVSPASVPDFGDVFVGQNTAQSLLLTNSGTGDLDITSIAASGDFSTSACADIIPSQESCSISLTFAPAQAGPRTGVLTITDSAANSPQVLSLSGTGVEPLPVVQLVPSSLTFASEAVGQTSAAQTVTIANTGQAPLTISSIAAAGDFAATNSCKAAVPVGGNCVISVIFTPTATGQRNGTLSITDNAAGSPQSLTLTGSGAAPGIAFTPSVLNFGSVATGSTVALGLSIANTGTAPLTISAVSATGDFAVSNSCPSIPAATSCSLTVYFSPSATGTRTGTISISDDLAGSPQTVPVSGTGVASGAMLTPSTLAFPDTLLGKSSSPIAVTLAANGGGSVSGITIATLGDFSQTNNCPTSLSGSGSGSLGQSCTISVVFTPTQTNQESGYLEVQDSAGQQFSTLSGEGMAPGIAPAPAQLTFGSQVINTVSPAQSVIITNTGNSPLSISAIAASTGFTVTSNCLGSTGTASLPAGQSCTASVSFAPTTTGQQAGTLSITDAIGTQTVDLSAAGTSPGLTLMPSTLTFGAQPVGATSAQQTMSISNTGTARLTLGAITASGDFAEVNLCPRAPATLGPGASCMAAVSFTPGTAGARTGSISVSDSTGAIGATAALNGTGTLPGITASPATLFFGGTADGTTSSAQTVTVTNTGSSPLVISSLQTSGDFTETTTCTAAPVAPGSECVVSVAMTPTLAGTETGSLLVLDNADGQHAIALSGIGTTPGLQFSSTALAFGSQPIPGANSSGVTLTGASQTVVLTNSSTSASSLTGLAVQGPFTQTNDCGSSLAAGASCTVTISFAPVIQGEATGSLSLPAASGAAVNSVALTGYGSPTGLTLSPAQINFGVQSEGTASATQAATLTNNTGQGVSSLVISASGEFTESDNCNGALASKASCTITISLQPQTTGAITGAISISGSLGSSSNTPSPLQPEVASEITTKTLGLAKIALAGSGSTDAISLSSAALSYGAQLLGSSSTSQTITLTNNGQSSAAGIAISVTGDFAETTTCRTSLAAGSNCTTSVVFKPTAAGTRTGQLTIATSVPSTKQTVTLVGTGEIAAPAVALSPTSLAFGNQSLTTTSSAQTVTLNNSGSAALAITSIAASGDFAETNTCGTSVAAGANCAISVTFAPKTAAAETGTLTATDNAPDSPQTIPLTGTGVGFTFAPPTTTSATVKAGSPATFTVSLSPGNFTGSVALSCTGAPAQSTCTVSPTTAALTSGGAAQPVTVTLTTTASSLAPPLPASPQGGPAWPLSPWQLGLLGLAALLALALEISLRGSLRRRARRHGWALGLALAAALAAAACGGGATAPPPPPPAKTPDTPAGTYTLSVIAKSSAMTQSITLTVTVQ